MHGNHSQPVFYIPHGGGPCFFMEWNWGPADTWNSMADWLSSVAETLPQRPRAILVVSAHWESPILTVTAKDRPSLIYDYYGFPPHTYKLQYPVRGDSVLAESIRDFLLDRGLDVVQDQERGLDHGVFIPFKLIYPDADVPIVQLSLLSGLDPATHLAIGEALSPLREDRVLIVGSGLSSHNLSLMMDPEAELSGSEEFNDWMVKACAEPCRERSQSLINWLAAPAAREVHPREEHLLPLMVASGAGRDDRGHCVFRDQVMGAAAVAIRFG
ncbi:MAG: class III extradiol ring-cleavage dioxygenase [Arenicellales bacterium]